MRAYLINLERRSDRLRKMTDQLNALGIDFERVDALDARLRGRPSRVPASPMPSSWKTMSPSMSRRRRFFATTPGFRAMSTS